MADVRKSLAKDADLLLLGELRRLTDSQFDEVVQQIMMELNLEPRKTRNKPGYYFAETISTKDQNRVILFVSKRDGAISTVDVDSLANFADRVRAPRSILMTLGTVTREADKEAGRRGVRLMSGAELATLIRESGIEDMILKDFAEDNLAAAAHVPPGDDASLEGQLMLGVEILHSGDLMRALEHFDRAIATDPHSELAWRLKGGVLDQLGHHEKALECYARALEIDENSVELWYAIGVSMYSLGRYDEELQAYERALKIDPNFEKALVNRGATLLKLQRYEEALESYDTVLKINYRLVKVHNNRGLALKHLDRLEEAIEAFDAALGLDSEFVDAWINKGALLLQLGRLEEALSCCEHVVSIRTDLSHAWKSKGEIEGRLGKRKEAIKSFERALECDPTNQEIRKALDHEKAKLQKEQRDLTSKIASLFSREGVETKHPPLIPETAPSKEDISGEIAMTESEEPVAAEPALHGEPAEEGGPSTQVGAAEEAEMLPPEIRLSELPEEELPFEEEIGEPPAGVAEEVFGDAAELLLLMHKPEVALDELEKGLRLEPMSVRMHLLRGRALHMLGRSEEALTECKRTLQIDSMNEDAIHAIEFILSRMGRYTETEEVLKPLLGGKRWIPEILSAIDSAAAGKMHKVEEHMYAAVSLEPSAIAWNYNGLLDLDQGDFEGAIESFDRAREQEWIFSDPSNNMGVAYFKLGLLEEAARFYDSAISCDPTNAVAWSNRGVLLYSIERYREALACFDQALLLDRSPLILINRGFTLLNMDDLKGALKAFDEALSIAESPEAYNNKGIVLARMNRLEEAINCFEAAIHLNPSFEDARNNIARYQPPEIREIVKERAPVEGGSILPPRTQEEVWAQLKGLSEAALKKMKKTELQEFCVILGLSKEGTKKELVERILTARSASQL